MGIGNKPIDDGNYLFTELEKKEFLKIEPESKPFFRRWLGADEFINGWNRWCLWLGDAPPDAIRRMPNVLKRVAAVRAFRMASRSKPTQALAHTPTRFHVEHIPKKSYLLIPRVSSEKRVFIPIGFISPSVLASDATLIVPDATLYHFGILTSEMHMAWVRQVCGRLESRYRYSNKLVYNNYPWPQEVSDRQRAAVEAAAQGVLDVREQFSGQTLADLYDPLAMPKALRNAHKKLDACVDKCYRRAPFVSERTRVEHLFDLYQRLVTPLTAPGKNPRRLRK